MDSPFLLGILSREGGSSADAIQKQALDPDYLDVAYAVARV
jgi:hypothetical protein